MKCPSCARPLPQPVPQCPHCRLTLRQLDIKFGAVPRHSRYLTDRTEKLPVPETARLRETLELFERKFPQILFSVFVAQLPKDSSISEYAFWLANRATFSAFDFKGEENFDFLLLIDPAAGAAAITIGYGLEPFLPEEDLQAALEHAGPDFQRNDIPGGIRACLEHLTERLRGLARASEKEAELARARGDVVRNEIE